MPCFVLVILAILAFGLVDQVASQSVIYVSKAKGNDSVSCGTRDIPCQTISRAISQAKVGSSIFLDSNNTTRSPYGCQPLTSYYRGIYVAKALSFIGGPLLTHVVCRKGQNWIVNGTATPAKMEVNFTGIAFQNSQFHFVETSVAVNHCLFSKTEGPVINFTSLHQNFTRISLQNVYFDTNEACISMNSINTDGLFFSIDIRDSVFNNNGHMRIPILPPLPWTILGVETPGRHFVDIHIKNSSFQGTFVGFLGMIYVNNQLGSTSFVVDNVIFSGNGLKSQETRVANSLFVLSSSIIYIAITHSQVMRSKQRLLSVYATWTNIIVSHTTVDSFSNQLRHGGTFYIKSNSMKLFIKDCLFSNGKSNPGHGGLLYFFVGNSSIHIEDSTITNLTTGGDGGVIYGTTRQHTMCTMKLKMTNSSFIGNVATNGGIIYVPSHAKAAITIHNCNFTMNKAFTMGGFMFSLSVYVVKVFIKNTLLDKNDAFTGGCFSINRGVSEHDEFVLIVNNATFRQNKAVYQGGVVALLAGVIRVSFSYVLFEENHSSMGSAIYAARTDNNSSFCSVFTLTAKHVHFNGNSADMLGGAVFIELLSKSLLVFKDVIFRSNSVPLSGPGGVIYVQPNSDISDLVFFEISIKRCLFEENAAGVGGVIYAIGSNGMFTCEDSVFRSNIAYNPGGALLLDMSNSTITMVNTTFFNNTSIAQEGGAVYLNVRKENRVYIARAKFENNQALHSSGGGLEIMTSGDTLGKSGCNGRWHLWNYTNYVEIKDTYFRDNTAGSGGALSMTDGCISLINCTFVNNFASYQGGHIINYGTNSLKLTDCTFSQTIFNNSKISLAGHSPYLPSFIHTYGGGPFLLINTTVDQQTPWSNNPSIMVSKGGLVQFNNFSSIICPSGTFVSRLNLSYNDWVNTSCNLDIAVYRLQCSKCERGFYSLQRGHTNGLEIANDFSCLPCPNGAECSFKIKSKSNFWGYLVENSPPALNFTLCPDGYCRSADLGSEEYNSCYGSRESWMCGRCAPGYSETLFSTDCRVSEDCDDNWFWLLFVALVFTIALLLLFKPPIVTFAAKQVFWFKNRNERTRDETETSLDVEENESTFLLSTEEVENEQAQAVGYIEIIFYFYQISNLLLTSTSLQNLLRTKVIVPIQGFFNFQERFIGQEEPLCPLLGITPQTKQLFMVLPVIGTFAAIYVIYALQYILCKLSGASTPTLGRYLSATMETLLLGYNQIINVSLSLVRCVPVGSETRWFYNGTIVCYQWWQIVLIVFDSMFVVPFILVLAWGSMKLHNGSLTAKQFLLACVFPVPFLVFWLLQSLGYHKIQFQNTQNTEYTEALKVLLLAPFREPEGEKKGAVYWQSILIGRRFILVFIYCFITDSTLRLLCMGVVCVLVLLHHNKMEPFKNNHANIAETISLLGLVILANINMYRSFYAVSKENVSSDWMAVFQILDWIEILMLCFVPAILVLLVLAGTVSLITRLIYVCCTSMCKRIRGGLRGSHERTPLINVSQ